MIESKSIHFPKYGHSTFESVDPAKRYLTLSAQQSFSGGCPESGPENVSGSRSIEIDPVTGDSTTSGDRYVNAGGTADSPTRKSGQTQSSSYDDPPNEKADCEGTIRYFSTLSNENTTTMMQTNGKSELEDYEDTFVNGTPYAHQNTHANELRYDYRKTQFKFKWQADTDEEAKFPVKYFVLFTPEDDPDTTETDESTEVEIVGEPIQWDGSGDESPVFELDPDTLKSGEDGTFRLLKVGIEEVEGTNENGELKIRGNVAVNGVFDRISISRDVAGSDVELDAMAYSGGNFEFTLDQSDDILRIDSLGRILSPDNFDLKISLEISGNVVASVDLPVEVTTEQTSGSDTYSYWYGDQNSGGSAIFRVFYPMELKETYVKVKYGDLVHKGRTNYLYVSDFESNFSGAGPGWGQSTMNVGHRYVGPSEEYPLGMTVPSSIGAPNTQYFEARTNKWVDEDYMRDLSHGEALMNHTFSGMTGPIAWLPPLDRTAESPDQGP